MTDNFNRLLRFLQDNVFNIALVEGPRGVGKSTFINDIIARSNFQYYKTWGREQKNIRFDLINCGLDLPQATFFVLDYIRQVNPGRPVIADRGNLSAMAYQREKYGYNSALHRYYAELVLKCRAVLVVLDAPVEVILSRRIGRKDLDENRLHIWPVESARMIVKNDCMIYAESVRSMIAAGLVEALAIDLEGVSCFCYTHKDLVLCREDNYDDCESSSS